jgi:uncharacterized protein involved in exopolysaccharide biosynthesis
VVLPAVRRHWLVAGIVALVCMTAAVLMLAFLPPAYTATTVLAVVPRPGATTSGELVRLAVPTYASLATSSSVAADVAEEFEQDRGTIEGAIRAENPPSTNNVLISVTWDDQGTAAELANAVADQLLEFSAGDPLLTSFVVAPAVPPTDPSFPPTTLVIVLGATLAVAAGVTAALLAERRNQQAAQRDVNPSQPVSSQLPAGPVQPS